jgi:hypothetical protein
VAIEKESDNLEAEEEARRRRVEEAMQGDWEITPRNPL